jgi:hypothetical protein
VRVTHQSPDLLIVAEDAIGMRAGGGICAAFGAALAATGARVSSVPAEIVGGVLFVIGLLFLILPRMSTFYFNRGEKRLVISRRRPFRGDRGYEEYPLRDVVAVRAEESRSTEDSSSTWRVAVALADGRSIPFTSYYTSGYEAKAAMAAIIAGFLGVETNRPLPAGMRSPHAIVRGSRTASVALALIFVAFGAVFGSIGAVRLVAEYHRLATWQPVQATVVNKRVDIRYDSDGNTYRPEITYRYAVNDEVYTSSHTLPVNESRSGRWAYRIVERFSIGERYTAWYDPAKPADAFIVRSHSIIAPIFTAIGLVVTLGGCAAVVGALKRTAS